MSKRRRSGARRPTEAGAFWGEARADVPPPLIVPTPDPGALPRSLGDPPLPVNAEVAQHHLSAVYEEAVRAATALAAVNGLLAEESAGADSL